MTRDLEKVENFFKIGTSEWKSVWRRGAIQEVSVRPSPVGARWGAVPGSRRRRERGVRKEMGARGRVPTARPASGVRGAGGPLSPGTCEVWSRRSGMWETCC